MTGLSIHPESTLVRACTGLNEYWGVVDSRAADLLETESDPRLTVELLPDWERAWGLGPQGTTDYDPRRSRRVVQGAATRSPLPSPGSAGLRSRLAGLRPWGGSRKSSSAPPFRVGSTLTAGDIDPLSVYQYQV